MDRQRLPGLALTDLGEAVGQTHAVMAAAHATLPELIAAFDRQEGWAADGACCYTSHGSTLAESNAEENTTKQLWRRGSHAVRADDAP